MGCLHSVSFSYFLILLMQGCIAKRRKWPGPGAPGRNGGRLVDPCFLSPPPGEHPTSGSTLLPITTSRGRGWGSPDRRLKGMFMPWCSRKPQAVLTSSEMALAACSSFSRSPDDCMPTGREDGRNRERISGTLRLWHWHSLPSHFLAP